MCIRKLLIVVVMPLFSSFSTLHYIFKNPKKFSSAAFDIADRERDRLDTKKINDK
jgi:hypothetical protein